MTQIRKPIRNRPGFVNAFDIVPKYDSTDSYRSENSYFGNGVYPGDWGRRKDAIWYLQDDQCGRCGCQPRRSRRHVHHVVPLSEGGDNCLNNLVGLCVDCHSLMHPDNEELNGSWSAAPKYPAKSAVSDVAVIKRDNTIETIPGVEDDLEALGEETNSKANRCSIQSRAVYDIGPESARRLGAIKDTHTGNEQKKLVEELNYLLLSHGRKPENELVFHRYVTVHTPLRGLLGWVSSFEPECTVESTHDGTLSESLVGEVVHSATEREYAFVADVDTVTVSITGGDGETTTRTVSLSEASPEQTVSVSLSPPPLSTGTLGSYLWDAGEKTRITPLLYGILWLTVVPAAWLMLISAALFGMVSAGAAVVLILNALLLGGSWVEAGAAAAYAIGSLVLILAGEVILDLFSD